MKRGGSIGVLVLLGLVWILFPTSYGKAGSAKEKPKAVCGNGVIEPGEECEGPLGLHDTEKEKCSVTCTIVTLIFNTPKVHCGNGKVEPGEECDGKDGTSPFAGESCSLKCRIIKAGVDTEYDVPTDPGELNLPGQF